MNKTKVEKVLLSLSPEDKAEWILYYTSKKERLQNELAEVQRNLAELKGETDVSDQYKLPQAASYRYAIHVLLDVPELGFFLSSE